jgi:hypothetical protein
MVQNSMLVYITTNFRLVFISLLKNASFYCLINPKMQLIIQ